MKKPRAKKLGESWVGGIPLTLLWWLPEDGSQKVTAVYLHKQLMLATKWELKYR